MVRQHHRLNGHESEQTLGDSGGQRSLAGQSPRGRRVGHDLVTEQVQISASHPPAPPSPPTQDALRNRQRGCVQLHALLLQTRLQRPTYKVLRESFSGFDAWELDCQGWAVIFNFLIVQKNRQKYSKWYKKLLTPICLNFELSLFYWTLALSFMVLFQRKSLTLCHFTLRISTCIFNT